MASFQGTAFAERKSWRLEPFIVIRRVDLQPGESVYNGFVENYLDGWLRNPLTVSIIDDLLRQASFGANTNRAFNTRRMEVRGRLLDAFRRRELVLLSAPGKEARSSESKAAEPPPQPIVPAPRPKAEKTWIEVQLVNKKGQPVGGARYRLKITDGSVREGQLDQNGSVRISGIDPGTCEISFLDYDAKEWSRA